LSVSVDVSYETRLDLSHHTLPRVIRLRKTKQQAPLVAENRSRDNLQLSLITFDTKGGGPSLNG
jgi:hypothetical protein